MKNKSSDVDLDLVAEAMGQLSKIAQELLRPRDQRDPLWRSIPVAKEITVSKGIAQRAPWENIQVNDRVSQHCFNFTRGWQFSSLGRN